MAQYRKKPVIIDAELVSYLINAAAKSWKLLPEWFINAYESGVIVITDNDIDVKTLEGVMKADFHDMLIKGVNGEIYPCKPDIFAKTYELVIEK